MEKVHIYISTREKNIAYRLLLSLANEISFVSISPTIIHLWFYALPIE
jgi:hypothetical protein